MKKVLFILAMVYLSDSISCLLWPRDSAPSPRFGKLVRRSASLLP